MIEYKFLLALAGFLCIQWAALSTVGYKIPSYTFFGKQTYYYKLIRWCQFPQSLDLWFGLVFFRRLDWAPPDYQRCLVAIPLEISSSLGYWEPSAVHTPDSASLVESRYHTSRGFQYWRYKVGPTSIIWRIFTG